MPGTIPESTAIKINEHTKTTIMKNKSKNDDYDMIPYIVIPNLGNHEGDNQTESQSNKTGDDNIADEDVL